MSSLKLFRSTEFALSSFFSPQRERLALHPVWAIVVISLWIATVCNVALWRRLAQLPELNNAVGIWFGIGLAVMIGAATSALLCLFAWRWTFKPVVTLFLLAAALGAYFMLSDGIVIDTPAMLRVLEINPSGVEDVVRNVANWRMLLSVLVLAVLPAVWLWRKPLRRVRPGRQLIANASVFVASCALLAGTTVVFHEDLASAMQSHAQLRYLVNPLNSLYALADIATAPTAHVVDPQH